MLCVRQVSVRQSVILFDMVLFFLCWCYVDVKLLDSVVLTIKMGVGACGCVWLVSNLQLPATINNNNNKNNNHKDIDCRYRRYIL